MKLYQAEVYNAGYWSMCYFYAANQLDAVTAIYPGSVLLERKCPTHDAWERLRLCPDCGCFLCLTETCDCEPKEASA